MCNAQMTLAVMFLLHFCSQTGKVITHISTLIDHNGNPVAPRIHTFETIIVLLLVLGARAPAEGNGQLIHSARFPRFRHVRLAHAGRDR